MINISNISYEATIHWMPQDPGSHLWWVNIISFNGFVSGNKLLPEAMLTKIIVGITKPH